MNDKILRGFVFGTFLLAVVLFSGMVSATLNVTAVIANSNSSVLYDEGHFTINWTAGAGSDAAANYTIYLWMNDNMVNGTTNANTTAVGYTFTNSTSANYTFTVEPVNGTGVSGTNSTNVSMYIDTTNPGMTIAVPAAAGWKGGSLTLHANSTDALSNVTSSTIAYGFSNSTGNFSITTP
ncbi:MAG: hypothetical protein KKB29_02580 [Nanoarchaeota archaeon]|nr:hypothetical protein [Nanoarchaeota archaeon]